MIAAKGAATQGASDPLSRTKGSFSSRPVCRLNGAAFGVFSDRLIDLSAPINLSFVSPEATGGNQTVVSQNISTNIASQEFQLYTTTTYQLGVCLGGQAVIILTPAQGYRPGVRFEVLLSSGRAYVYEKGVLIRDTAAAVGAAREPTAPTRLGCRGNGPGTQINFFTGVQFDFSVNGALWPISNKGEASQGGDPALSLVGVVNSDWIGGV